MMRSIKGEDSHSLFSKFFAGLTLATLAYSSMWISPTYAAGQTSDLNTITTANIAAELLGSGVTINTITHTGNNAQAGTITLTDSDDVLGISSGVILSSGVINHIIGPNQLNNTSTNFGGAGDSDLAELSGVASFDASILEINFTPTTAVLSVEYVFGSDEYPEYANGNVNDAMAFFVNDINCSQTPQGTAVSINTINGGNPLGTNVQNPDLYNNNALGTNNFNTEMDGFTDVLTCVAPLHPNVQNTLKVAIGDGGDAILDSWLVLEGGSLSSLNDSDTDGDGTPDSVEVIQGTNPNDNSDALDNDSDGHPDFVENGSGSSPIDPNSVPQDDADGDGVPDYVEVIQGTNPNDSTDYLDSDNDLVPDYIESVEGTDTADNTSYTDSDTDTLPDYVENTFTGTNPNSNDSDDDGKLDAAEVGSDVFDPTNTDNDNIIDALDSATLDTDGDTTFDELDPANTDPCIPSATAPTCDQDNDGLTNAEEDTEGTDPLVADTDDDGIDDGDEVANQTDPLDVCNPDSSADTCDTDQDTVLNGDEDTIGTDKTLVDTDGDGENDADEIGSDIQNPLDNDTDGVIDALESSIIDTDLDTIMDEADPANTDPCIPNANFGGCDQDNDGLTNDEEALVGTNPLIADTDSDGENDGDEVGSDINDPLDTDEDGVIDALESSIVDTDEDSVMDEMDPNDDQSCTPDPQSGECDQDNDGLSNNEEGGLGLTVTNPDTDDDGENDGDEVGPDLNNPLDTDDDGIIDALESSNIDTDSDGVMDEMDPANTDPCIPNLQAGICDQDQDGLTNDEEDVHNTDKVLADTDGDGENDGDEIGSDSLNPLDTDNDGTMDVHESSIVDTDGDEVMDEADPANTDPCIPNLQAGLCDQDEDGLTNDEEITTGTDPQARDSDDDGIDDGDEIDQGTLPNDDDTDNDGIIDGDEVDQGTNPLDEDSDNDGIDDAQEQLNGSDAMNNDDDSDGVPTQTEINAPNNGDANADGIPDYMQTSVSSKPSEVSGRYTSLVAAGECTQINDIEYMLEADLSVEDPEHDYFVGLHNFELECSAPGQEALITIVWDQEYDTTGWDYFKFNPNTEEYFDISSQVTYGTIEVDGVTKTTSSYAVRDGSNLDSDGIENAMIFDPAGPTILETSEGPTALIRTGGVKHQSSLAAYMIIMGIILLICVTRPSVSFTE